MKITKELAELVGIIIGDGNIHYNLKTRKYYIEITGNPSEEKEYYHYISSLYMQLIKKPGRIRISGGGLRLRVYSKQFVEYLIKDLKMDYNKDKAFKTKIPNPILSKKNLFLLCLRGIFDTDGSFFLANKGYRTDYPCIEISTCSKTLANQIQRGLKTEFRIKIRKQIKKRRHILSLNGDKETEKFFIKIGSSNYKKEKYKKYLATKDLKAI